MKILMAAVFSDISTNNAQADGFRKCGWEVIEYNYREIAKQLTGGNAARDKDFTNLCAKEKPDYVFFSKCTDMDEWVVDECNKHSKTIMWYMDPVDGNFTQHLVNMSKKCNYVFCGIYAAYEKMKFLVGDKCNFLHEGYDHRCNFPVENEEQIYDVSFIGTIKNQRRGYYQAYNFTLIQDAFGLEHSKAVARSKINLNFTEGGTSDRSYKVLASKGFLLTEAWPRMEDDFTPGEDLIVFTGVDDMIEKINYYLENPEERERIAKNGYNKVQKFSRIAFAEKIINTVQK